MPTISSLRIIGSGPVALAFALFARRQGFTADRIRLERFDQPPAAALAGRQLAMSLGSWQLLSRIAAAPRAAPIEQVDVCVLGHPGRTHITAREMKVPALGFVLRYSDLLGALQHGALQAGLEGCPTAAAQTDPPAPSGQAVPVDPGEVVVHAEGDTGQDASVRAFGQSALLAEVAVEFEHGTTAYECFTAHGPLALLPLPEPRRYSLVWCAPPQESERRAALAPEALAAELQDAFGWALGRLAIVSPCVVAPMIRRARRQLVDRSAVWIGNAAQALHPVGGQGLNLGLRDAFLLAAALGKADARGASPGEALADYRQRRRVDRGGTLALTDTLASGFGFAPLRPLQSLALSALDLVPAARAAIARQFMFGLRG